MPLVLKDGEFDIQELFTDASETGELFVAVVEKPWGKEEWIVYNRLYALKRLTVDPGEQFSLQFHDVKTETWFIVSGEMSLTYGWNRDRLKTTVLRPGDVFHLAPNTIHRAKNEGTVDLVFIEVQTPHLDDVVRLEDDYGRSR